MKIGIITWLENAEFEDMVLEALLTQGISKVILEYRALAVEPLIDFLKSRENTDSRFILIHSSDEIPRDLEREIRRFPDAIRLKIEPVNGEAAIEIERSVNRALREFESEPIHRSVVQQEKNLIVVTGTSGAPGTTTIALNLGSEASLSKRVELVDLHPNRRDLAFLLGAKRSSESVRLSDRLYISGGLSADSLASNEARLRIIDAGPMPKLESAFSDRRAPVRDYVDLLERAERIIYLMTPENNHMFEIESFLSSFDAGRIRAKPIFLLNQFGGTRRERSIQKRFSARVGKHESHTLPFDREALDRAKSAYSALQDVAPRSKLRRSLGEVAKALLE
ncbi:MAG: hypothetical protein RLZZ12_408 [Actinomycetota bacterium]|jgi:Flp pilus assembly CpaE family ATPase